MPLDAITLQALVAELRPQLVGLRIDKVQQPARDQVILLLRGNRRLLLNAGANAPRLQLTELLRDNPAEPPMFCMLLRKHLVGARVADMTQPPMERLVRIELDITDEFGRPGRRTLVLEAMGRRSNLILLDGDGRIVRQDALRAVVDVQPVRHGLDHERARPVRHEPVELRGREVGAERRADQVQLCQRRPCLRETGAAAQQPRDEFKLRHVALARTRRCIRRVADEVQPGHAEALLVHRVVVERIAVRDAGRADDGIVLRTESFMPELERIGARRHDDLLAVAALIVERPAHRKIAGQIGCRCTHTRTSFSVKFLLPLAEIDDVDA